MAKLGTAAAAVNLSTAEAAELFEYWGFTRSGRDFLRKLERCGVLAPVPLKHQRAKRWATQEVLKVYFREHAGSET